jgi:hypothetical protein
MGSPVFHQGVGSDVSEFLHRHLPADQLISWQPHLGQLLLFPSRLSTFHLLTWQLLLLPGMPRPLLLLGA